MHRPVISFAQQALSAIVTLLARAGAEGKRTAAHMRGPGKRSVLSIHRRLAAGSKSDKPGYMKPNVVSRAKRPSVGV